MLYKWKQVSSAVAGMETHTVYTMSVSMHAPNFSSVHSFIHLFIYPRTVVHMHFTKLICFLNCLTVYNQHQRSLPKVLKVDIKKDMFTIANFGVWDKDKPFTPQTNTAVTLRLFRHICVTFKNRKPEPVLTPPAVNHVGWQVSEHVFAKALSATITCLHCMTGNLSRIWVG